MKYEKNVKMDYYLPKCGLQILSWTIFQKMYIFFLIHKNTNENRKFYFLKIICEIRKKRKNAKLFV